MLFKSRHLLTRNELQRVEWGESLDKEYLYTPFIYYTEGYNHGEDYHDDLWYSLRFNRGPAPNSLLGYQGKVLRGQTLWKAVRRDLEKDFGMPHEKSFTIEYAKYYDTRQADGRLLTRILVELDVREPLNPSNFSTPGTYWHFEDEDVFNPIWKYFS